MEAINIIVFLAAEFALAAACINLGLTIRNGANKKTEAPTLNPVTVIKQHKKDKLEEYREKQSKEQAEAELKRLEIIMNNIETYDGTGRGQEDVPRG